MTIKVICTTIPTTLTIAIPGGSGVTSLDQMHNGATPFALRRLDPGTSSVIKVSPGAYMILGDGVNVTCNPASVDHVQIVEFTKTDPPEQMRLTLKEAPFTESEVNAFISLSRSGSVPPPLP